jgi:hypothetical protein
MDTDKVIDQYQRLVHPQIKGGGEYSSGYTFTLGDIDYLTYGGEEQLQLYGDIHNDGFEFHMSEFSGEDDYEAICKPVIIIGSETDEEFLQKFHIMIKTANLGDFRHFADLLE